MASCYSDKGCTTEPCLLLYRKIKSLTNTVYASYILVSFLEDKTYILDAKMFSTKSQFRHISFLNCRASSSSSLHALSITSDTDECNTI